ncbi:hypothetical protein ACIGXM_16865 [Kitasatospora sp. NPDC052896]|uniref:hypothetical protein n=1 Tax=Kitasatospora sp. NPDC052896 TaxID=3364061 RepID=UPI0037C55388
MFRAPRPEPKDPRATSPRKTLLVAATVRGRPIGAAGAAAACDSANLGGALNSGFGNARVNGG